jgi:hypothetical protein
MWSESDMKVLESFPVSDWKDEEGEDWWWYEFVNCKLKEEFVTGQGPQEFMELVLKDLKEGLKVKEILVKYLD